MPIILEAQESLPYIDAQISDQERKRAIALVNRNLLPEHAKIRHPSIPALPESNFSVLLNKETERVGAGEPRVGGIDLSRYEAPDEPSEDADVDSWRTTLQAAYTSSTYLSGRHTNLDLLEEYGKNAWLISNAQLEQILKTMEAELEGLKQETEAVNRARKTAQKGSRAEILGLEDTWKRGIGKIVEVQVATDALKGELLERRRTQQTRKPSTTRASQ